MNIPEIYNAFLQSETICHDSRQISPGCIYWAIRGERFDGNTFAAGAFELGASYAVVDREEYRINEKCFWVEDSLVALQELARHHRRQLGIPVLAITGSNGKTTSKELMQLVLSKKYSSFATPGNLNNHIGLPLSLLRINKTHEVAIIELGANHRGENAFLCEICEPECGIITNIGKDHLEGFGGMEGVEKANMELFDYLKAHNGQAIINLDDERVRRNASGLEGISYGHTSQDTRLKGEITSRFPFLKAKITDKETGQEIEVRSHLFGSFQLYNLLAATATGIMFGVDMQDIKHALESYIPKNNRSQVISKDSNTYIMDAYNANPSSMGAAVADFSEYPAGNKVLILGDMFELGEESALEHEAILQGIKAEKFKAILLAGDAFYAFRNKYEGLFFRTTEEAKLWFAAQSFMDTTFYLKGSRGMKMENVVADSIYY